MKFITNTIRRRAAVLLLSSTSLLAVTGCNMFDDIMEVRRGREIALSATAGKVMASTDTRCGKPEAPRNRTISLISADGSIVIPVTIVETETQTSQNTRGGIVNGPDSDGSGSAPLSNYLNSFAAGAYNTDTQTALFTPEIDSIRWNGTDWRAATTYYWPQATSLDIYARANMPTEDYATIAVSTAARTQTLSYTVPADTDDQTDILMAMYSGTGDNEGVAALEFYHPLVAVQFSRASSMEISGITQIIMSGVNFGGEVTQSIDDPSTFNWTVDDREATVSQDNDGKPFEVHGEIDGDPFFLVPQVNTGSRSVVLTVTLIYNGHEIPLNAIIDDMHWIAGRTYTFRVGYEGNLEVGLSLDETSSTEKGAAIVSNAGTQKCYVRAIIDGYVTDNAGYVKRTYLGDEGGAAGIGAFTVDSGTFGTGTWNTNWVKGSDGFYYYRIPLEVDTPDFPNPAARTTPLFNSYTFTSLGMYEYYEMNISIQSIEWDSAKYNVTEYWGAEAAALLE